jgi:hypothetical protein
MSISDYSEDVNLIADDIRTIYINEDALLNAYKDIAKTIMCIGLSLSTFFTVLCECTHYEVPTAHIHTDELPATNKRTSVGLKIRIK